MSLMCVMLRMGGGSCPGHSLEVTHYGHGGRVVIDQQLRRVGLGVVQLPDAVDNGFDAPPQFAVEGHQTVALLQRPFQLQPGLTIGRVESLNAVLKLL